MPIGRAGIALVERPVCQAIEKHGRGARKDHAEDHQRQHTYRWKTVRRRHQRAQRERQRKDGMGKTNQTQKTANRAPSKFSHGVVQRGFLKKVAKETKIQFRWQSYQTESDPKASRHRLWRQ